MLGGLLDSNLPIRCQQWFMDKVPFDGGGLISEIPAKHRLSLANPTFRGNTSIPEGANSSVAVIQQQTGVFIQELPFTIKLNKFNIDYYSTGMPKLFASDVTIYDHENGKSFPATIKVNQPLVYKGLAVYQSSVDDGGSRLSLTGHPMTGAKHQTFEVKGEMHGTTSLKAGDQYDYTVEWVGFRPFNVENMSKNTAESNAKQSISQSFASSLEKHTGSAAKNANSKDLKMLGPVCSINCETKTVRLESLITTCCRCKLMEFQCSLLERANHQTKASVISESQRMMKIV